MGLQGHLSAEEMSFITQEYAKDWGFRVINIISSVYWWGNSEAEKLASLLASP